MSISSECSVCSSPRARRNFGAITCQPCAAFFRRTVSLRIRYVCRFRNECPVSYEIRTGCRACRFEKCHVTGMQRSLVQERRVHNKVPKYIERSRGGEVVRVIAHSNYSPSTSSPEHSPSPDSEASTSSASSLLDVSARQLLAFYSSRMLRKLRLVGSRVPVHLDELLERKCAEDQWALEVCSECPGVKLLAEHELDTLFRYCSFVHLWLDAAWLQTRPEQLVTPRLFGTSLFRRRASSSAEDVHFQKLLSSFHSTLVLSLALLKLDVVEYSALKALCIWRLGVVDFTTSLSTVGSEQTRHVIQALHEYYRLEKQCGEAESSIRIADIVLLISTVFDFYRQVMQFYGQLADTCVT